MNSNMTITCTTCEQDIDCRIGYSNRVIQPLSFACPNCESLLEITLDISDAPQSKFSCKGCEPSKQQPNGPFTGKNPFVNLHLDFPVRGGKYEIGQTPYMVAVAEVTQASDNDADAQAKLQSLYLKLGMLNDLHEEAEEIRRLINLYNSNNKQLFQRRAAQFLERAEEKSLLPQDVNATLYRVLAKAFFPFTIFNHGKEISEGMPQFLQDLDQGKLDEFIHSLEQSSFLATLHRDCLKIYPRIFEAELPLRPALFLDLVHHTGTDKAATKVSSQDFQTLKDLYKDIIEIINRQLVLVAGLNNLNHRGDADSFKPIDGGTLSNLKKFSEKTLSDKFKYLDDCWFNLSNEIFNLKLRNAIAHNNVHYEAVTQNITYYPEGGRLEKAEGVEMFLLDFARLLLNSFRELHNLNHVMKSIIYYKHLIYDRRQVNN